MLRFNVKVQREPKGSKTAKGRSGVRVVSKFELSAVPRMAVNLSVRH